MKLHLFAVMLLGWGAAIHAAGFQKMATHFNERDAVVPIAVRQSPAMAAIWRGEQAPVNGMKVFAREKSGAVWLGSPSGAARFAASEKHPWDRWQHFAGRRWLLDDDVQNISLDESGAGLKAWIRTKSGISLIEWRPMSLEEKADYFDRRIEARHVRHGLVADCGLSVPGDTSSYVLSDSDNDGLWTAIYVAAQCYRFAVTKDPMARARAQRGLRAVMRLEEITGVPGFYARSFKHKSEPPPHGGEWHPTADGNWVWKGDTSSDESVGHYYAYAVYYDLVANASEKEEIRKVVSRMTDYLIEHDYDLLDLDGKPTRWGEWSERFFKTEEGQYEAPLRSIELLSFLKTTLHITGNSKYAAAYEDRVKRGYAERTRKYRRWDGGGEINFSDDELAYLSYAPLMEYEKDKGMRAIYLDGLRYTWSQIRSDINPLWCYMTVLGGGVELSGTLKTEARMALERVPMDLVEWGMRNSHRLDLKFQPEKDRFGRRQLVTALPADERAVSKWNGNPYQPDGGGGSRGEDDGSYFLLPYWLGRYQGWVK